MKKIIINSLIFIIIFSLFSNCDKYKANKEVFYIKGSVRTVSEFNYWYTESEITENIMVSLENIYLDTVNEKGEFLFNDIQEGSYDIIISKDGYSDLKIFDIQTNIKIGNQINNNEILNMSTVFIYEKSSTIIESDLRYEINNEDIIFYATIRQPSITDSVRYFKLMIYENDSVAYDKNYYCSSIIPMWGGNNMYQRVSIDSLITNIPNFDFEKKYYAVAYGASYTFRNEEKYYDNDKKSWVYIGLNDKPSNIISFKITPN